MMRLWKFLHIFIVWSHAIFCLAKLNNEEDIVWPSGYIKFPQWFEKYEPNENHRWNLLGSTFGQGKYLTILFDFASIEGYKGNACENDWLAIYNETNSYLLEETCSSKNLDVESIGVYCNHRPLPKQITIPAQNLAIEFCSDDYIEEGGFQLRWTTTSEPPPVPPPKPKPKPDVVKCGSNFTLNNGEELIIESPNFDKGPYPPNMHCQWNIAGAATVFSLTSLYFELEDDNEHTCLYDYLSIKVESDSGLMNLGTYCGSVGPDIALLPRNAYKVTIDFFTNEKINWSGFKLRAFAQYPMVYECNKTVLMSTTKTDKIDFYTPNYPAYDITPGECALTLQSRHSGRKLFYKVSFLDFAVEEDAETFSVELINFENQLSKRFYSGTMLKERSTQFQGDKLQCSDGNCVSLATFCDGEQACLDGTDESSEMCNYTSPYFAKNCGRQRLPPNIGTSTEQENRIIEAKPHTWPSTVLIRNKPNHPKRTVCVGTLISQRWVITSASCMSSNENPESYEVLLGVHDLSNHSSGIVNVLSMFDYADLINDENIKAYKNDFMLVKLDQDVKFNDIVSPACLPPFEYELHSNAYCVQLGWFADNPRLIQRSAKTISNSNCAKMYRTSSIDQSFLCTSANKVGKKDCHLHKGSPLLCQNYKGMWTLQGTLSTSDCVSTLPNVYDRLTTHMKFIYATIAANSEI